MDLRLGCHELRRDGNGSDDRGDTGPGCRLWFAVATAKVRRAGEVERVRGSGRLGRCSEFIEGLVNVLLAKLLPRGNEGSAGVSASLLDDPAICV